MNLADFFFPVRRAILPWILLGSLAACGKKPAPPHPSTPEVTVYTVQPETISVTTELPGRLDPVRVSEVRARATGILLKQLFRDGSEVKEGEVLFEIDPAPLQAGLSSAQANLSKAEANQKQSAANFQRYQSLIKTGAISRQDYDQAVATSAQANSDVQNARAAVETAQLNLGYAKVTAPISGRIGKASVTEGALVSSTEATKMATIQQLDPIYFDFTQSSTDVLRLRRALDSGTLKNVEPGAAQVTLLLEDGSTYATGGKLLFSDVAVDPTTGMITLRAEFPNPDRILLPGMFARGRLEQAVNNEALTVPQRAVARGPNGTSSVLIVGDDNKVQARVVQAGNAWKDKWIIASGLKAGERIVLEGLQKAPPGSTVKPVPAK
ncbi:MAG: efflux RND transporter periplasmic adaptor subunit [Chthoniobacterales bacterium]